MDTFPEPGPRGAKLGYDSFVAETDLTEIVEVPDQLRLPLLEADGGEEVCLYDDEETWHRHRGDPELDAASIESNVGVSVLDRERARERMKEPRRYRRHANAKSETTGERRFDTTALHYDQHGRLFSHADYIAHCEKYDYVWRNLQMGDRVLDVGCGTDAPFMRAINFVQSQAAKVLHREGGCYVGVDLNPLKQTNINWAELIGNLDATSDEGYEIMLNAIPGNEGMSDSETPRGYTLITCLEVIEHMDIEDGTALLQNFRDLLSVDGRVILSTPVYDGKGQARNHIHEYYIDELWQLIEDCGLQVVRRMGTFTAEPQIKKWMKENRPDWLELYLEAREFHSAGYMSGVIAPMVPDMARNNVWVLEHAQDEAES